MSSSIIRTSRTSVRSVPATDLRATSRPQLYCGLDSLPNRRRPEKRECRRRRPSMKPLERIVLRDARVNGHNTVLRSGRRTSGAMSKPYIDALVTRARWFLEDLIKAAELSELLDPAELEPIAASRRDASEIFDVTRGRPGAKLAAPVALNLRRCSVGFAPSKRNSLAVREGRLRAGDCRPPFARPATL